MFVVLMFRLSTGSSPFRCFRQFCMALSTASDGQDPVEKFKWLLGRWVGSGKGEYATINTFTYGEQVDMHISPGKPVIIYNMKSWNPDTKAPLHVETGFLKIRPHTDDIAFVLTHNFGATEISEGRVSGMSLSVSSMSVSRVSFNNEPTVLKVERDYWLADDGSLQYELRMQTSNQPLQKHLEGRLEKVKEETHSN